MGHNKPDKSANVLVDTLHARNHIRSFKLATFVRVGGEVLFRCALEGLVAFPHKPTSTLPADTLFAIFSLAGDAG